MLSLSEELGTQPPHPAKDHDGRQVKERAQQGETREKVQLGSPGQE